MIDFKLKEQPLKFEKEQISKSKVSSKERNF